MQCHRSLSTSGCSLNYKNLIPGVTDNSILLFLDGTDDVFQLYLTITSKLCFQDLIINLHITFKFIDHFTVSDFILPLRSNFSLHFAKRSLIKCLSPVKIIEQTADRCSPVVDQRHMSCLLCKISNPNIECLWFFLSLISKIHSSKKRGIHHSSEAVFQ